MQPEELFLLEMELAAEVSPESCLTSRPFHGSTVYTEHWEGIDRVWI